MQTNLHSDDVNEAGYGPTAGRRNLRAGLALGVSSAMLLAFAPAVWAQDAEGDAAGEASDSIVVTGSRIPSANLESVSPVTTVGADEFLFRGVTRVEDLLNDLPQTFSSNTAGDANGATGTANVDLRGLGTTRTLVLQNGRRLPAGSPGSNSGIAPDLNFIPGQLIQRVEVLTGGASATYGSDAIAGVVNFITMDDFEGIRLDYQYSFYQHNNDDSEIQDVVSGAGFPVANGGVTDGDGHEFSMIMGANTGDGKGNVTAYATYRHIDEVLQANRDYSSCALTGRAGSFGCGGSSTIPTGRFTDFGILPEGQNFDFTVDQTTGDFRPIDLDASDGSSDLYNYGPLNYYQRPDERYTFGGVAHYEINRAAEVYSEVGFMNNRTVAQIAPSGAFFVTNTLPCSNPFLSEQQFDAVCGSLGLTADDTQTVFIGRRNVEGGPRQSDLTHTTWRGVFGVRGDINDAWSYDVYGVYGENNFTNIYRNDLSITNIGRALDVVPDPETGEAVCASALNGVDPNCVPWNIFTPGGADVTDAALAYLIQPLFATGSTEQTNIVGTVTGDLSSAGLKSPYADDGVLVAVGAEYREDSLIFEPDNNFLSGDGAGQGGPTLGAEGTIDVSELFGEIRVPLAAGMSMAEELTFEAGYRWSDYSINESTNTYKFALSYAPTADARLRTSYQRAVRAPNIRELFRPSSIGLFDLDEGANGFFDPCAGPQPARTLEECARTGVTAAQYGSIADSPAGQFNDITGGNPDLAPETSTTISVGGVFTPAFVPGLAVSIDWYTIDVEDAISNISANTILTECLNTGDAVFCDLINRGVSGNGTLWLGQDNIVATDQNIGFFETSGIDFTASYGLETGYGDLAFNWVATNMFQWDQQEFPGGTVEECQGVYSSSCGAPRPEWTSNLRTTWSAPFGGDYSVMWRYFGGVEGPDPFDSQNYLDFAALYPVGNYTLRAGVNNFLDQDPPLTSSAGPSIRGNGNTFPGVYDALGRYFFFGVTADF